MFKVETGSRENSPEHRFMTRPSFGTLGKQIRVRTNFFKVKNFPKGTIYQYDVQMIPEMPPSYARLIYKEFEEKVMKKEMKMLAVYDGRKALYSPKRLPNVTTSPSKFEITLNENNGNQEKRVFTLQIKEVRQIDMNILQQYIDGNYKKLLPQDTLQVLDVLMRHQPSYSCSIIGRSLFTPKESGYLGQGVDVWNGYYQSIRPGIQQLLLNLDVSSTPYYESGPVIQVLSELLQTTPKELELGLHNGQMDKSLKFFKGTKVRITYRGSMKRQYRVIGLSPLPLKFCQFPNDTLGRDQSVAEFFYQQYNAECKYLSLPCFLVGNPQKPAMIPLEFCELVEGQRYTKKLNELQTAAMIKQTCIRPENRFNKIMAGWYWLGLNENPYLSAFGLELQSELVETQARVLKPPRVEYSPSSREPIVQPRDGGWNLRDKRLLDGKDLMHWFVLCIGSQRDIPPPKVQDFISQFCQSAEDTGMRVSQKRPQIIYPNRNEPIELCMTREFENYRNQSKHQVQLIMCILTPSNSHTYGDIKRVGETILGIPTQCLQCKHIFRPNRQYCANVTLKINAKLGGVNQQIERGLLWVSDYPTMILGADVTHSSPGEARPSICALVASMDRNALQYASHISIQRSQMEIIQNMKEILVKFFRKFYERTNRKPKRLMYFRDGVSEGQFEEVALTELKAIYQAWAQLEKTEELKVTFIVVQKRHHARFVPLSRQDADRNGNIPSGTLIDKGITSPALNDFYLCSHGSIQGTSKPAHYFVLFDENHLTPDQIQQLCFEMCFTFCRATRAVGLVSVGYYADILAYRARYHLKQDEKESLVSGSSMSGFLGSVKRELEDVMYFV